MASYDPDANTPPMSGRPQSGAAAPTPPSDLAQAIRTALMPLASLKITIVLFALSIFLVLVGTLAQARMDIWDVVGQYFRCWIARVIRPYAKARPTELNFASSRADSHNFSNRKRDPGVSFDWDKLVGHAHLAELRKVEGFAWDPKDAARQPKGYAELDNKGWWGK